MPPLRAWVAVHAARAAAVTLVVTAAVHGVAGRSLLSRIGPAALPLPTPLGIFLTVAYGAAIALMGQRATDPQLEILGRRRALPWWRLAWLTIAAALTLVVACALTARVHGPVGAVASDVTLFAGLSVLVACWWDPDVAWVPTAVWVLLAGLFGGNTSGGHPYQAWAFVLDPEVRPWRVVLTGAVWCCASVVYATTPRVRSARRRSRLSRRPQSVRRP